MSTTSQVPTLHPYRISDGYLVYDIVACVFTFAASVCVGLRFLHRQRTGDFWWDDWTILASLVFSFGVLVGTILISAPSLGGAGYHITTYTVDQLNMYLKIALATDVLYNPSVALSKASVLLFYRRIFSIDGQFLWFMRVMAFLLVGNCLAAMGGLIFADNPVEAQWNVGMPFTTINNSVFWTIMAVINILLDIIILGVAQIKVWRLRLSAKRKLLVSLVFLLGAFTIIASILRIVYLLTVDVSDLTYTLTVPGIWTDVEMNMSIICACLPVMYSLFRRKKPDGRSTTVKSSAWAAGQMNSPPPTIGSTPSKYKPVDYYMKSEVGVPASTYHASCETSTEEGWDTHSMEPLEPVRVRTEYRVT